MASSQERVRERAAQLFRVVSRLRRSDDLANDGGLCSLPDCHWSFLFWYLQHLRKLPELTGWSEPQMSHLISQAVWIVTGSSIVGNFLAASC